MKEKVSKVVLERDSKAGVWFDYIVQLLIIVSIVSFTIETLPNLTKEQKSALNLIEVTCVILFSAEYVLRVILAKNKLRFIFSFFGIIDLLAILPFYLSFGIDLRSIRALRMLRLFRLFKLARYNKAISRIYIALKLVKEELIMFLSVALILIYLSGVGIYYFETYAQPDKFDSIFSSLWWAVATLTTVGYGDVYPITVGGKIFTFIILMVGLGIVAIPSGMISSALSEARHLEKEKASQD